MSIENIQAGFCLASLELQVFKSLDDLFPFILTGAICCWPMEVVLMVSVPMFPFCPEIILGLQFYATWRIQ